MNRITHEHFHELIEKAEVIAHEGPIQIWRFPSILDRMLAVLKPVMDHIRQHDRGDSCSPSCVSE